MNKLSTFWYGWLVGWCWYIGVFALVLVGGAFEFSDAPIKMIISLLNPAPYELNDHVRFGVGIQGSLTIAIAILCHAIIRASTRFEFDNSVWRALFCALCAWFVIDGIISVATHFYLNVLSNTIILVLLAIPLLKNGLLKKN